MIRNAIAIAALTSPPPPRWPVALAHAYSGWEVQRPRDVPNNLLGLERSGDGSGRADADGDSSDDSDDDDEQFKVSLHNRLPDVELDFVQVIEVDGEDVWEMIFDRVKPDERTSFYGYEGDVLLALRSGTKQVRAILEIDPEQAEYSIYRAERSEDPLDYVEPTVQRHAGVLPPGVCKTLIELGEKSAYIFACILVYCLPCYQRNSSLPLPLSAAGFIVDQDSIDVEEQNDPNQKFIPALTTDVYKSRNHPDVEGVDTVVDEAIWKVLQPWIPIITRIVKDNRDKVETNKLYPDATDRDPELDWIFL
ncbi:hypothetical protein ACHAWF_015254 [Thalassiosira exigua]